MGRRKQRPAKDTSIPSNSLEPAWPSSPVRPPRYVLYCFNHQSERRYIVNSYGLYAIRKIFDMIVGDHDIEPSTLDPDHTMTFGDIDIKSDQMNAILNHQYSAEEEAWELPAPYINEIPLFLSGPRMGQVMQTDEEGKPEPRPAPVAKPKIDRTGKTSIQDICEELKMEAREARGILRKLKIEKPAGGWIFDPQRADEIKAMLLKEKK